MKLSALDAAAKVLSASGEPMTTKELIDAMAAKGYWTSTGGKTPQRTLYSALTRDNAANGKESPFKKGNADSFGEQIAISATSLAPTTPHVSHVRAFCRGSTK